MKRIESSVIFGIALICVGVLFLLQNLGVLGVLTGCCGRYFSLAAAQPSCWHSSYDTAADRVDLQVSGGIGNISIMREPGR